MEYYQILKNLREDADLKQKEISEKFFLGKNTYYNYENGKREMPFKLVVELAKFYGVSLDYIAGLTTEKNERKKSEDEEEFLNKFKMLSPKDKGRIIGRMEEILEKKSVKNKYEITQKNNGTATININNK